MKQDQRARQLLDIGSTTALSAMVEILESNRADRGGILTRQAKAMLARLDQPRDQDLAIEGFCDELQTFVESVPGIRGRSDQRADKR